ncbi:MAG: hypothetical protein NTW87_17810 [Planctomycetota bacterium]|nr:hypothetical protein [Planctomycetota bacterium]
MKMKTRLSLLLCLSTGAAAALAFWLLHTPVPAYLGIPADWEKLQGRRASSWGRPCTYFRFRAPETSARALARLRTQLDSIGPWEQESEETAAQIIAERKLTAYPESEWPGLLQYSVPAGCYAYAVEGLRDYVLLTRFRHEKPATHYSVVVRVAASGDGQSLVEVWDWRLYDH